MAASLVVVSLKDLKPALDEETLLSPHIFILDQQILSSLFNKHVNQKDIIPLNLKGIMISHLMFVDDLLWPFVLTSLATLSSTSLTFMNNLLI